MSNILIVESKNDKIFLEALINKLNLNLQVDPPICINDYECLEGLDSKKITNSLKALAASVSKNGTKKVGIVIDLDQFSIEARIKWVDKCIEQSNLIRTMPLQQTSEFIQVSISSEESLQLACYFTNVDGKGELETVLKAIKTQDSTYADCLESWKACIENQGKKMESKEFDKFWISNYLRFDTCSLEERKSAGKKCSLSGFEYIMKEKRHIWNFDDPILDDLKAFLRLFG